jgi:hypothetical protein
MFGLFDYSSSGYFLSSLTRPSIAAHFLPAVFSQKLQTLAHACLPGGRAICYSIAVCNSSVVATFFISRRASRNASGRNKNSKAYATQHGMSFEAS